MRTPLAIATVATGMLAAPAAASAEVSCRFGSALLTVELSGPEPRAVLTVGPSGGVILVRNEVGTRVPCAGPVPTITEANAISVFNQPGLIGSHLWIERAPYFAPGLAGENGGTPEVEIFVNFNDDPFPPPPAPAGGVRGRTARAGFRVVPSRARSRAAP